VDYVAIKAAIVIRVAHNEGCNMFKGRNNEGCVFRVDRHSQRLPKTRGTDTISNLERIIYLFCFSIMRPLDL